MGPEPTVTVTLDALSVVLLVSSILYGFCLLLVRKKLAYLDRVCSADERVGPKRLLILSVGVVCTVRISSFLGVISMDISNVGAHYSLRPIDRHHQHGGSSSIDKNQAFYDAAMTVLFDLPNCVIVSVYILLALVWAECFLMARFHNQSTYQWKKRSLTLYAIFNSLLYSVQMIMYILVIAGRTSGVIRTAIYAAAPGINFFAVLLVLLVYVYASFNFAGYPFRGQLSRQRLRNVSNILLLWSLTRLLWGSGMLYVFLANIELLQDSRTPMWSSLLLFAMLVVCEIIPTVVMLDYSYISIAGFEKGASRDMSALASGQRALGDDDDDGDKPTADDPGQRVSWHGRQGGAFGSFTAGGIQEPLLARE